MARIVFTALHEAVDVDLRSGRWSDVDAAGIAGSRSRLALRDLCGGAVQSVSEPADAGALALHAAGVRPRTFHR